MLSGVDRHQRSETKLRAANSNYEDSTLGVY